MVSLVRRGPGIKKMPDHLLAVWIKREKGGEEEVGKEDTRERDSQ